VTARFRELRPRGMAIFVVVATVVAVLAVTAARELGVVQPPAAAERESPTTNGGGDSEGVDAQSEPLMLAIGAPATCETKKGVGYGLDEAVYDDDGNFLRVERRLVGWYEVSEFEVVWDVRGGRGPYRVNIDGATGDANGLYQGRSGVGSVLCIAKTVETFIDPNGSGPPVRALRADPDIDSGWKTIRASVTDAQGVTAQATADVYVILHVPNDRHLMRGGSTYRVFGELMTIPSGIDMRISTRETGESGYQYQLISVEQSRAGVWFDLDGFAEVSREIPEAEAAVSGVEPGTDLDQLFDELAESIGKLPTAKTATE